MSKVVKVKNAPRRVGARPAHTGFYAEAIREDLKALGMQADSRHVEAYMRLQYGTLDHLDRRTFRREVRIAAVCANADPRAAEELAGTYSF